MLTKRSNVFLRKKFDIPLNEIAQRKTYV